jgi:hypothetical protein
MCGIARPFSVHNLGRLAVRILPYHERVMILRGDADLSALDQR